MNVRVLVDGAKIGDTFDSEIEELNGICPGAFNWNAAGDCSSVFVGMASIGNSFILSLPKRSNSKIERKEWVKTTAVLLFRTLLKYREENPIEAAVDEALWGGVGSRKLCVAFELLDDFGKSGLLEKYKIEEKVRATGNIAWKRTISRSQALHSSSGVLYPKPYVRQRAYDEMDQLRRIHARVVTECYSLLGWILDIEIPYEVSSIAAKESHSEMLSFLDREKKTTYSARELKLIALMQEFLLETAVDQGCANASIFGTLNFDVVWEKACKAAFADKEILRCFTPQPKWHTKETMIELVKAKRPRQVPDILAYKEETLYVLDAKYYDVSVSLPGWHDIVKQIYYQDTAERMVKANPSLAAKYRVKQTVNAFLFPYDEEGEDDGLLVGNVDLPELDDGNRWGNIAAYVVNTWDCLGCYVRNAPNEQWLCSIQSPNRNVITETDNKQED